MNLTDRLENMLRRQTAWLEETLAWYVKLDSAMNAEEYEALLTEVSDHGKAIDAFTRERDILQKEWRESGGASVPDSLKLLAARVSALTDELRAAQSEAAAKTAEAAQRIQDELGTLQKGRGVLEGYRAGDAEGVRWLDRNG